jgi:pantoate--beta-alanine ligase
LPIEIVGAPIVRAQDGLALSSRNAYLDSAERKRATCLFEALTKARSMVAAGERSSQTLISHMRQICEESGGTVDYVDIVDLKTLKSVAHVDGPCRAVLAVGIGPARLLDNTSLP